jgi:uncharacterized protein
MMWAAILALGLVAGTLSGMVGFGAATMLMPALMRAFGAQRAVPIMAVAGLIANASRVVVWWRGIDWRANGYYWATAVPCGALGARTLLMLDPRSVASSVFCGTRAALAAAPRHAHRCLAPRLVGAAIGFLSGMVASTGPINAPFFLAHGFVKGAYLSSEALGSMAIGINKSIVFQRFEASSPEMLARGLVVGCSLMIGSRLAKGFVLRLAADQFRLIMDGLLVGAGVALLWGAFSP